MGWAIANPSRVAALVLLNTYYAFTRGCGGPQRSRLLNPRRAGFGQAVPAPGVGRP